MGARFGALEITDVRQHCVPEPRSRDDLVADHLSPGSPMHRAQDLAQQNVIGVGILVPLVRREHRRLDGRCRVNTSSRPSFPASTDWSTAVAMKGFMMLPA